jgi:hypothetical protein
MVAARTRHLSRDQFLFMSRTLRKICDYYIPISYSTFMTVNETQTKY